MDKILLMKTLPKAIRSRNLERLEEIGDIMPKMRMFLYDENDDEDLNDLIFKDSQGRILDCWNIQDGALCDNS